MEINLPFSFFSVFIDNIFWGFTEKSNFEGVWGRVEKKPI